MIEKIEIEKSISSYLSEHNMFIVDITTSPDNNIEVFVESKDNIVSIDNCQEINNIILDKFDKDVEDYSLTISSAGLDQPFKVYEQYIKFTGSDVEIILKNGIKIKGVLSNCSKEGIGVTIRKMEKVEGKKRKVETETEMKYLFDQIKTCKPLIKFK